MEALASTRQRYSVAEYLAFERAAINKHEYDDGEILAMSGASIRHVDVNTNLIAALHTRLRGTTCRARGSDVRLRLPNRRFVYADSTIFCAEVIYDPADDRLETATNPRVIFEVL